MAAPSIRGVTAPVISTGAATSPSSTAIGDLVLVFVWSQGTAIPTHTLQSGYTEILSHSHNDGSTDGRLSVAYIVASQAGAQSYTAYSVSGATANQTCVGIVVLQSGTYDVSSLPPSNSSTLTTNAVPNPPSVASLTGDFRVFAIGAWHVTTAASTATSPGANYSEDTEGPSGSHVTHLAIASRALTGLSSATEDPPAFTDNVTPNGSASMTIAVKGALDPIAGSLSKTLDNASSSSAATLAITAGESSTLDAATSSSAASLGIVASAALSLGGLALSSTATIEDAAIQGSLSGSLATLSIGGSATVAIAAGASAALGAVTASSSASSSIAGAVTATLGSLEASSAGSPAIAGSAGGALGDVSLAATAAVAIAATAAPPLGDLTVAGAAALGLIGAAARTFAPVTLAASSGTPVLEGAAAITLAPMLTSSSASLRNEAAAAAQLSSLTMSTVAAIGVAGQAAAQLGAMAADASATLGIGGSVSSTLEPALLVAADSGEVADPFAAIFVVDDFDAIFIRQSTFAAIFVEDPDV